jgi:hypothetical protein
MVIPAGMVLVTTMPAGPSVVLDVSFVTVIVYVDAVPATTGVGTDTATIPVGEVTLSAPAAIAGRLVAAVAPSTAAIVIPGRLFWHTPIEAHPGSAAAGHRRALMGCGDGEAK